MPSIKNSVLQSMPARGTRAAAIKETPASISPMETSLSGQAISAEGLMATRQDSLSTMVSNSEELWRTNVFIIVKALTRSQSRQLALETEVVSMGLNASSSSQSQQLVSPPTTPAPARGKTAARKNALSKKSIPTDATVSEDTLATAPLTPKSIGTKRKRATSAEVGPESNNLPHGLGTLPSKAKATSAKGGSGKGKGWKKAKIEKTALPSLDVSVGEGEYEEDSQPKKTKTEKSKAQEYLSSEEPTVLARLMPDSSKFVPSKRARAYQHRWGETPFPDYEAVPTEAYQMVNDLLTHQHGKKEAPAAIPPPSQTFAGCGETPCIIDALIRTRISANTDGNQTSVVIQSMLDTFGSKKTGTGKDSINWDVVRHSPIEKIIETLKFGGNQNFKARDIKGILEMVCKENNIRRQALADPEFAKEVGLDNNSAVQESAKIALADSTIVSLDHMHALSYHQAFSAFIEYPGIALKTASCVCLYCLQRPSFAVDTHVKRITGWLGWRPEEANENKTFTHLEYLIPDELKYSLHTLFVVHGKECVRCASETHEETPGWEKGCVIDHLVKRVKNIDAKRAAKALKAKPAREANRFFDPYRNVEKSEDHTKISGIDDGEHEGANPAKDSVPKPVRPKRVVKSNTKTKEMPILEKTPFEKNKAAGARVTKTVKASAKVQAGMTESVGKVEQEEGGDVATNLEEEENHDGSGGEEEQ